MYNELTYIHLIDSLLYCTLFITEDDALALKHVGVINKQQYNKLTINCAFVCSLYIKEFFYYYTVEMSQQMQVEYI
jgi:hypothetical protein